MAGFRGSKFDDRRDESAKAKQALLEKFRAQPAPDDPARLARQAELKAIADAREQRIAERRAAREAELARLAAEEAARIAAEKAAAAEREAKLRAEQKAARDARYAARKARR